MEEMVDIIDENENILETITKKEARINNLMRRGANIIVFNSDGKILFHKRAAIKDMFPNLWDFRVGGWIIHGESVEEAATRETEEEIGAKDFKLEFLFKYKFKAEFNNEIVYLFKTVYDGSITPQVEEVAEYEWIDVNELDHLIEERTFVPDAIFLFENYKEKMFGGNVK